MPTLKDAIRAELIKFIAFDDSFKKHVTELMSDIAVVIEEQKSLATQVNSVLTDFDTRISKIEKKTTKAAVKKAAAEENK